ncbi:neutral/alkaline non-lysosomal ceramidase N-terminal domain-containing protein [Gemmata sp.]|uniref:neutral/alkaline non-lysosomal ceramidase N-terminal domain-containing protein n=1 Tax=Gemmata sp. TaxID=1914242 RepID=UPI003F70FB2A
MTTRVETPQSRCVVGFGRADVTPPVGIYHRMWGAALHDRATGVHRPLTATALWLESLDRTHRQVVIGLDHCLLDRDEFDRIRTRVGESLGIGPHAVLVAMAHTHGSAWMSRSRSHLPGGDLIAPYLDELVETCGRIAAEAAGRAEPGTLVYGTARCDLARHRDFWDAAAKQFVCGFNPGGPADDTVLVAKAVVAGGKVLGTVVNYACHPTTLAWENTLISPDYVGAMREVVERHTGAPCLFLQGASGQLGPREGFVGDPAVADRNGRQLGYAALSGLEALPEPGTVFEYAGPVVSGATLGTWKHKPLDAQQEAAARRWQTRDFTVPLQYRKELPTEAETRAELARWETDEATARSTGDANRVSECRARAEQMTRQLTRLAALPAGKGYPFPVSVSRLGGALWVFVPGELYQEFQVALRTRFPQFAVVVSTITNDWQPGYLPAAPSYGHGIYQDVIAAVSPGSLEVLIESVCREITTLV